MNYDTAFSRRVRTCLLIASLGWAGVAGGEVLEVRIAGVQGLQFDTPRFAVEPGQQVRLEFVNEDTMPHNLLIVEPGTREEVAMMAIELLGEGPEKHYVPDTDKVRVASRVLLHNESQTLEFIAPENEGVYPYVCTFPGHAVVMFGAMHVTTGEMPPLAEDPGVPGQVRIAAGGEGGVTSHVHDSQPDQREDVLRHLTIPEGFEAVAFAQPPDVMYPTALAPTDQRVVFVGIDGNGSLGRREGRGSIVRAEDTSGNGVADHFTTFAEVDTPRGVVWDGNELFVLHPPHISAFRDTTGDGIADESSILVRNIGYGIDHPRGGDHTTNGLRMGIDGWLYVAVGDFGFERAVGTDGTEKQLYGGGVARVRPDGSDLEIVATGLRNIYDVAISPVLDIFARDNDNDGDGWDTRLVQIFQGAEYGYPRHFTNFADEILPPLVRYGRGSPTGAFFLDEPGWPAPYNKRLYTAEWNHDVIDRHELEADGAQQTEGSRDGFLRIPSPTAIAADANSTLYVASWYRGGYNFSGPDVGFVVGLRPEGYAVNSTPSFDRMGEALLVAEMGSGSQTRRFFAQREILRRGETPVLAGGLEQLAADAGSDIAVRVAAVFTLKQLLGEDAHEVLIRLAADPQLRAWVLRALADREGEVDSVPSELFVESLADEDARVRLQAVVGIGRLGRPELAEALVVSVADEDHVVAHAARKSLVRLGNPEPLLSALDSGVEGLAEGAGETLKEMHVNAAVDGLIGLLEGEQPESVRRIGLAALSRLYYREWTDWDGRRDWWGTRPDRRGPYFRPTRWERTDDIHAALLDELGRADGDLADWLANEMERNRIEI